MSIRPLEPENTVRMTNAEAVILCRFAKACCPQQQFDAYTPDAWFELLHDLRFEDCKTALTTVAKRQLFVAPSEIRDEVKRVRSERIGNFGVLPSPPSELSDRDYAIWFRETIRAIADGELVPGDEPPPMVPQRDVIAELGHIGRSVDDA